MLKIEDGDARGPSRVQTGASRMKPVYGVFLSAIPSPSCESLWVLFDPLKGIEGLFDLFGCRNTLKDVVLKEMVGWVAGFLGLKDESCVSETGNLGDMGFLLSFSEDIFGEVLENTTICVEILALHLPFGGFPGGTGRVGSAPFDDKESFGVTCGMKEDAGSQIDPPSFGGMLHIGVGFYGVVGKMGGSAMEAWLEHIKGFHLPCAGFLEKAQCQTWRKTSPSHSSLLTCSTDIIK